MPASTPAVQTLTRAEFERLEHHGAAGPAPSHLDSAVLGRWRTEYAGWRGRHWAFLDDTHGVLRLHPVNVARNASRQSAAA